MNIKVIEKADENILAFEKAQWAIADTEHYGVPKDWNPKKFVIVAYEDTKIVGSLEMQVKVGVAEIETLIVADTQRGAGVGTSLLQEAEKIAKENNAHKLYLFTGKGWKAEAFYQKYGMQPTGELKDHYAHNDYIEYCKFI